jgi:hypothetical protein
MPYFIDATLLSDPDHRMKKVFIFSYNFKLAGVRHIGQTTSG